MIRAAGLVDENALERVLVALESFSWSVMLNCTVIGGSEKSDQLEDIACRLKFLGRLGNPPGAESIVV
jgi:hypothetical protein